MIVKQNSETFLIEIGQKYINFLIRYGLSNESIPHEEITALFAQHCKKIIHGELKGACIHDIKQSLYKKKSMYGSWIIEWDPKDILSDPEASSCSLRYTKTITLVGTFITKTVLLCDELGFIIEIQEHYQLKQ